ncbi:NACHT domain-containing protein [Actinokineospora sp. PR83]|uniref:NACHT domain-containing protein n=1 Tax=Actinokineospora sp. PR83 TaxID=2884908 RepID=UPI0027E0FA33|nr:NACHT domain-containing protein [Actinokineospora sp. PR83]MCG8915284.1 NACHT domain-containing protein [Actinokineospora sp. PR83]
MDQVLVGPGRTSTRPRRGSARDQGQAFERCILVGFKARSSVQPWGVTVSLESAMLRTITGVGEKLFGKISQKRRIAKSHHESRPTVATLVVDSLVGELTNEEVSRLHNYLTSAEFEEVVFQYVLGVSHNKPRYEELRVEVRQQIRYGLRNNVRLRAELVITATDVITEAFSVATRSIIDTHFAGRRISPTTAASAAHLVGAATANSRLLQEVIKLDEIYAFAENLRRQVRAQDTLRLPHLGVTQPVAYDQLFVSPKIDFHAHPEELDIESVILPGCRSVILGNPGAGKSTFAAKLAFDIASDNVRGSEGRTPFLLEVRDLTSELSSDRKTLVHYVEQACRDPYNLQPPANAVEYLLRNGRAVLILDGIDELTDTALRKRFVRLVENFSRLFPSVPIVVTARIVGYDEAPLDSGVFAVGTVLDWDTARVEEYIDKWFALDSGAKAIEQARLAAALKKESIMVFELRRNPLMLALICTMYSADRFIPENLAQVYERCASMLFDKWDNIRGIPMPMQFRGHVRSAIQYLAWFMVESNKNEQTLSRQRVVHILATQLIAKNFEKDEAFFTAEGFVAFCTGRIWILTDVGASSFEPLYGFTHRTFMEYFAAEHLTRTHPDAAQLWEALRRKVLTGGWDVIAQVALQQLDRNQDAGVDNFLRALAASAREDPSNFWNYHRFAAQVLGYTYPDHGLIRAFVRAMLEKIFDLIDAKPVFRAHAPELAERASAEHAFSVLLNNCSEANRLVVRRTLVDALSAGISQGRDSALLIGQALQRRFVDRDGTATGALAEMSSHIVQRNRDAYDEWRRIAPRAMVADDGRLSVLVLRHGPQHLYVRNIRAGNSGATLLDYFIQRAKDGMRFSGEEEEMLFQALLQAPTPWIEDPKQWSAKSNPESFLDEYSRAYQGLLKIGRDLRSLLLLPFVEHVADGQGWLPKTSSASLPLRHLIDGRRSGVDAPKTDPLAGETPKADVTAYLGAWQRKEFSIIAQS